MRSTCARSPTWHAAALAATHIIISQPAACEPPLQYFKPRHEFEAGACRVTSLRRARVGPQENSGIVVMLENENISDLTRAYELFKRVKQPQDGPLLMREQRLY